MNNPHLVTIRRVQVYPSTVNNQKVGEDVVPLNWAINQLMQLRVQIGDGYSIDERENAVNSATVSGWAGVTVEGEKVLKRLDILEENMTHVGGLITELLNTVNGGEVFTSLDIKEIVQKYRERITL